MGKIKKINLSIPKPCHENWEGMSKDAQGRFCNSCQKSVVDFTNMSDRQLADFFKKPVTAVCGRFHHDQLERELIIPKKRIPWIKYFFQITWPALVFFLKSCGSKDALTARMLSREKTEEAARQKAMPALLGDTVLAIMPVDTSVYFKMPVLIESEKINSFATVGLTAVSVIPDRIDTEKISVVDSSLDSKEYLMDTVRIISSNDLRCQSFMGDVVRLSSKSIRKENPSVSIPSNSDRIQKQEGLLMFPNPIKAGSVLTISVSETDMVPDEVQLMNASGQLIESLKQDLSEYATTINIRIPERTTAGIYFVRLTDMENKKTITKKLIIQ